MWSTLNNNNNKSRDNINLDYNPFMADALVTVTAMRAHEDAAHADICIADQLEQRTQFGCVETQRRKRASRV